MACSPGAQRVHVCGRFIVCVARSPCEWHVYHVHGAFAAICMACSLCARGMFTVCGVFIMYVVCLLPCARHVHSVCHEHGAFMALSQPCVGYVHGCAHGVFTDTCVARSPPCVACSPPHVACSPPRSQLCARRGDTAVRPRCRAGRWRSGSVGVTQARRLPPHLALRLPVGTGSSEDTARKAAACAGAAAAAAAYPDRSPFPGGWTPPTEILQPLSSRWTLVPTPVPSGCHRGQLLRSRGALGEGGQLGGPHGCSSCCVLGQVLAALPRGGEGGNGSSCGAGGSWRGHPAPSEPPRPVAAAGRCRGCLVPPTPCSVGQ